MCSCAVLPFLVRTWSGLAHANGIKSPSTAMSSPYSQCALWGARVVPGVSLPWSLPSCSPSLPSFTTPSSQTSLVTHAAFSLLLLQPCRNFVQMLPVMRPVQMSWAWHVDKTVLRGTVFRENRLVCQVGNFNQRRRRCWMASRESSGLIFLCSNRVDASLRLTL